MWKAKTTNMWMIPLQYLSDTIFQSMKKTTCSITLYLLLWNIFHRSWRNIERGTHSCIHLFFLAVVVRLSGFSCTYKSTTTDRTGFSLLPGKPCHECCALANEQQWVYFLFPFLFHSFLLILNVLCLLWLLRIQLLWLQRCLRESWQKWRRRQQQGLGTKWLRMIAQCSDFCTLQKSFQSPRWCSLTDGRVAERN